jgi:hypothetical protein
MIARPNSLRLHYIAKVYKSGNIHQMWVSKKELLKQFKL